MITNERQYKVSKSQLREFTSAIQILADESGEESGLTLSEIHRRALNSQREELEADIAEYEALRDGKISKFEASGLESIPRLLIKARIARGLTQKQLADLLEVKEQQIQRWEANHYSGASLQTISRCIQALNIITREEFFIPDKALTFSTFLTNLKNVGISSNLACKRILPIELTSSESPESSPNYFQYLFEAARNVSRIFGYSISDLLNVNGPLIPKCVSANVLYKTPVRANPITVNAYTIYAHYLACVVESCVEKTQSSNFPSDWHALFKATTQPNAPLTLSKALDYFWGAGVVVIPLRDGEAFHGAVWKIKETFVIVLKQNTALEARWIYDLLHEGGHIAKGHVTNDNSIVEETEISTVTTSEVEVEANEWAENAIFDGDSEEIEQACVHECKSDTRNLKKAVLSVAYEFNINVGCLANHMAYRMQEEGEQWWGTAHKIQENGPNPFEVTRNFLLSRINLRSINEFDRELVIKALSED